jgi:uncharacterized membrane protein YqjE
MTESVAQRSTEPTTRNMGDVLEDALLHAKTLIQAELSLARQELSSELHGALGSLLVLSVGAMFLQAALLTLGVLLIIAFGVGIASGVVIAVFFAIGATCVALAGRALSRRKLPRTAERLSRDAKQVLETVK